MNASLLARVLLLRRSLNDRDRWNRSTITAHQEHALHQLRTAAYVGSRFYRRHHAGLERAPLGELAPVTKADLMEHFDDAVTEPGLKLAAIEQHLRHLVDTGADPGIPWQHRWWTAATAGTTGRRGIFIWNQREWATVLA
jgi:phenylacetate-CoA ligase